jgi:ethanolamine ammonia-lyase small subunit
VSSPLRHGDIEESTTFGGIRAFASATTTARLFLDGPGTSYSTADLLKLRADHAAARDAVYASVEIDDPGLAPLVERHGLFAARSLATSLGEYLARPSLGRILDDKSRDAVGQLCPTNIDIQIVIGDGLSPRAVAKHGPPVLELLTATAQHQGWSVGRPFFISRCRVGVMNDIGDLIQPVIVVLLIGERPGLATAESMSAYLGYRPQRGHTDADRNLVCNIHDNGVRDDEAVERVLELCKQLRAHGGGGFGVKEVLPTGPEIGGEGIGFLPPPSQVNEIVLHLDG